MAYTTPNESYYQQISNEINSNRPGNQLLGNIGQQFLPTAGAFGLQAAAAQQEAGLIGPELGLSNAYQSAMAGFQTGQLGIRGQQIGLSRLGTQQEQALQGILNPLEQQSYALSTTQYPEQRQEAALTYRNRLLQEQGNIAQSGAQGTLGAQQELTTMKQQYGFQLQDIARSQQLATLSQRGTLAQQKYTTEQLNNALQNLSYVAESNGLSQQEVMTRLNYAITQGQLGAQATAIGILTHLGQIWSGAETNAAAILGTSGYVNGMNLYAPPSSIGPKTTTNTPQGTNLGFQRGFRP